MTYFHDTIAFWLLSLIPAALCGWFATRAAIRKSTSPAATIPENELKRDLIRGFNASFIVCIIVVIMRGFGDLADLLVYLILQNIFNATLALSSFFCKKWMASRTKKN